MKGDTTGNTLSAHSKSVAHKAVPRWLRMSVRIALLVGVVAVPALAVKEPSFVNLFKYRNYSIAFMVLGTLVLPIWEPNLGMVVVIFTLLIPMGLAALWLAYGLFAGCSNIIFMMGACVVVTFIVLFGSELLSLPTGMLSVCASIFVAGANTFVSTPPMAFASAVLLTGLLFVAAVLATLVCWLVFPEFCVDEVFRCHHEGLEHLLHLGHHALGSQPPPLIKRVRSSEATKLEHDNRWKAVFRSADEQAGTKLASSPASTGEPAVLNNAAAFGEAAELAAKSTLVEQSWSRLNMAFRAATPAQLGAKSEVVLAAVAHKRLIIPCMPLIPCAKGQMDEQGLLAVRHVAVATSFQIYKLFNATHPLDEVTSDLMYQMLSSHQWLDMRTALVASLQELVDTFPMDYYPVDRAPDHQYLTAFQNSVHALAAAWQSNQIAHKAVVAGSSSGSSKQGRATAACGAAAHAVSISSAAEAAAMSAAALDDVFGEPLVAADSAAAGALSRMNVAMIVRMLKQLADQLQQLYDIATIVSGSLLRFKCC